MRVSPVFLPLILTATVASAAPHTAQSSLDWQGLYVGTLPCASCPGFYTELQLLGGREGMGGPGGDHDEGGGSAPPPRRMAPSAPAPRAAAAPAPRQAPPPRPASGFDDMDDSIPF